MKRQLSLVLALVMILGSFSSVFAAVSVDQSAVNVAGNFLKEAKVLEGDDGNLMLNANLKRRDAVVLMSRLYDEEAAAKVFPSGDLTFTDLTDDYYNGFIAWSVAKGIIEGHNAETFGFNEEMTAQQFATVLLRVLGYEITDDVYPKALEMAEELEVLVDIEDLENTTVVTRGMMALMAFNALYVDVKGTGKTLAATLGIDNLPEREVEEVTVLSAKVNNTENLKEVVLELSNAKLVDLDSLENTANYKVVNNDIDKVEVIGNNVVVTLRDALLQNREYKLRVRSIDKAINKEYTFVAKDNTIPTVESVEFYQGKGIKLRVSEPINLIENVRGRTFELDGKNIAMDVEMYGRDLILIPYYGETFSADAKTLTVTGLTDFAGFRSSRETFELEFTEDKEAPVLVDLILRGDKTVDAVFDKDVYDKTVDAYFDRNNLGNISYESGRHNVYAQKAEKIDTNKVRYTFKDEFLRTRTDFTLVDVANHSNVAMEKTTMVARAILDNNEPEIFAHQLRDANPANKTLTIRLSFDKDVIGVDAAIGAVGDFDVASHFRLFERDINVRNIPTVAKVASANYVGDRRDLIDVKLTGLTEWSMSNELDYILEIENFTDITSRNNRMFRDYVGFKFQGSSDFVVTDFLLDEKLHETHVTVKFNKWVDRAIAEDPTNYIFTRTTAMGSGKVDVKDLGGRIITEKNGYEVILILPDFNVNHFANLRVLDTLKSTGGQRLDTQYTYTFGVNFGKFVARAQAAETKGTALDVDATILATLTALSPYTDATKYNQILRAVVDVEKEIEIAEKAQAGNLVLAKTALQSKIALAEGIYNGLATGTNKANLAVAIADAKIVLADQNAVMNDVTIAVSAIDAQLDVIAAKTVEDQIGLLPAQADVTLGDKDDIEAADLAYTGLTADQRLLVTNKTTLDNAKLGLVAVESAIDTLNDAINAIGMANLDANGKVQVGTKITTTLKVGTVVASGATNAGEVDLSDAQLLEVAIENAKLLANGTNNKLAVIVTTALDSAVNTFETAVK